MVNSGISSLYQHQGANGRGEGTPPSTSFPPSTHSTLHGQQSSNGLSVQVRRYTISPPQQNSHGYMDLLLSPEDPSLNPICTLEIQSSRLTIKELEPVKSNGMDLTSSYLPMARSEMGTPLNRHVRLSPEPSFTSVLQLEPPPISDGNQCASPELVFSTRPPVPLPTLEYDNDCDTKIGDSTGQGNSADTELDNSTLVSSTAIPHSPPSVTSDTRSTQKRPRTASVDSEEFVLVDASLEHHTKRQLVDKQLSTQAEEVMHQYKDTTERIYHNRYSAFCSWCNDNKVDPLDTTGINLINYYSEKLTSGAWKLSTLYSYNQAILQVAFSETERSAIRNSEAYKQFFDGARASTMTPPKHWDYDIQPALDYIISLGPNDSLSLELLTQKTAWLLAMVGFLRPADLERVDLAQSSLLESGILKLVIVAPKEKRHKTSLTRVVSVHAHDDSLLCPVAVFTIYQQKIATSTTTISHPTKPHIKLVPLLRSQLNHDTPIGAERISNHIKVIMKYVGHPAGAPLPKAKALGTTLAAAAGVPVDSIVHHGNWSSKDMFESFYRISSNAVNMSSSTLKSTSKSPNSKYNIM